MTAQISILNKNAVVLATDSAVTLGNGRKEKAFNTAEKLFELIRNRPVGIMIYNAADFNGVSWEILIKEYGRKNSNEIFLSLDDYKNSFLDFLRRHELFNDEAGEFMEVYQVSVEIANMIFEEVNTRLETKEIINEEIVMSTLKEVLAEMMNIYKEAGIYEDFRELQESNYLEKYSAIIENIVRDKVNIEATNEEFGLIVQTIERGIYSNICGQNYTGIVIAGYGENDYFPKLCQLEIYLSLNGRLKIKEYPETVVGKGLQDEEVTATLRAFAQHDMVDTFMQGIDPALDKFVKMLISTILDDFLEQIRALGSTDDTLDDIRNEIEKEAYRAFNRAKRDYFIEPITTMLESLGKQQLAEMAETLIDLTSFKRKMSMETETVGGPVDIAVISKYEGFIWIKRKYYFNKELNPAYEERRKGGCYEK